MARPAKNKYIPLTFGLALFAGSLLPTSTALAAAAGCAGIETSIISCGTAGSQNDGVWGIIIQVINFLAIGVGIAVVGGLVWGGMMYASSNGDSSKSKQAIKTIVNSILGLVLFMFMYASVDFLVPGGFFASNGLTRTSPLAQPPVRDADSDDSPENERLTTFRAHQVLIIGDSITERPANNNNYGQKGWWEYLLDNKSGRFKFSAQGGSGYVQKGKTSRGPGTGTSFYDRLGDISRTKPKAIIIAGGLNDRGEPNLFSGIRRYYDKLEDVLRANDIPKENVYVIVPRLEGTAEAVAGIVRSNANRIGVRYVDVGSYRSVYDKLHPTSEGARTIYTNFTKGGDFDERLK